MARVAGIQVNKTPGGKIKSLTIDVKKHGGELKPFFDKLGLSKDSDFEKEWSEGITGDELVSNLKKYIRTLPWKK